MTWVKGFLPERAIIFLTFDIVALPLLFSSGYLMVVLSLIAHYFATSCLSLFIAEVMAGSRVFLFIFLSLNSFVSE